MPNGQSRVHLSHLVIIDFKIAHVIWQVQLFSDGFRNVALAPELLDPSHGFALSLLALCLSILFKLLKLKRVADSVVQEKRDHLILLFRLGFLRLQFIVFLRVIPEFPTNERSHFLKGQLLVRGFHLEERCFATLILKLVFLKVIDAPILISEERCHVWLQRLTQKTLRQF